MKRVNLILSVLGLSFVHVFANGASWRANGCSKTALAFVTSLPVYCLSQKDSLVPLAAKNYCKSGGLQSSGTFLDEVWIGAIKNKSGNNGGYADFIHHQTNISRVGIVTGYVRGNANSNGAIRHYAIWIDYDHNGKFDDSVELVTIISSAASGYLNFNFTVPYNAMLGETRMRITMSTDQSTAPCGKFEQGETEDYTLLIGLASIRMAIAREQVNSNTNSAISIVPNPVADILHIRGITANTVQQLIEVFDASGRKQMMLHNSGNSVNVNALTAGTYIIRIILNGKPVFTGRFVKL